MINEPNKAAYKNKSYTIPAFYNAYLRDIEPDTVYDISYSKYRLIVTDYFLHLRKELLEESKRIRLPYRMGTVLIVKKRPKDLDGGSLRVDYKTTKELGKLIFHLNEHSDGFKYRCYYNKQDMNVKNKSKYQLVLTRANKRWLAAAIKSKEKDYEEIW